MTLKEIHDTYNLKNSTDKDTIHSYLETYDNLFSKFQNQHVDLLEIGSLNGGSLYLWHKYFKSSNITSLDIAHNIHPHMKIDSIKYMILDAYNVHTISLLDKYDVIIDDGPHTLDSFIFFTQNYVKLLNPQGIAIIEDIQDEKWINILDQNLPPQYVSQTIDLRNIKNRYDDILYIIKGANDE